MNLDANTQIIMFDKVEVKKLNANELTINKFINKTVIPTNFPNLFFVADVLDAHRIRC